MKRVLVVIFLLGFILLGAGVPLAQNAPKPLSGVALENVMAFTRLLAYVRYFHPSDAVADTDWDKFALAKIESVEAATTPIELAKQLEALFKPYAPTISVYANIQTPPAFEMPAAPKDGTVTFFVHEPVRNFANPNPSDFIRVMPGRRISVAILPDGTLPTKYRYASRTGFPASTEITVPSPNQPLVVPLNQSVTLRLPIALYTQAKRTLPLTRNLPRIRSSTASAETRAVRLAVFTLAWGYFQHFYTYWNVVKTDWSAELKRGLEAIAIARPAEFDRQMELLIAQLQDGHASSYPVGRAADLTCELPFSLDVVENRLVVTTSESQEIKAGDVIKSFDSQPALDVLNNYERLISGSSQWKRARATLRMMRGSCIEQNGKVKIELESGRTLEVSRSPAVSQAFSVREIRPAILSDLGSGAVYLDLIRVNEADFDKILPQLAKAQHIVFDMRGYPNRVAFQLLGHLSDQPLKSAPFWIPVITRPDGQGIQFADARGTWATPQTPQLTRSIAFVTNANSTISYAESIMGIIEGYDIGFRVGSVTAGTNGDVARISLPDGYSIVWTGLHVTKFDGTPLMNIGILPTHPAQRTIAGVKAGRDELLEAAFTLLTKQNSSTIQPRAIAIR